MKNILKNSGMKNVLFIKFKQYRNSISILLKFSKKKYYRHFFSHNINNIKTLEKV